ncbi:MAG: hypothetical protein QXU20_04130, partial [Candidatus Woesearchaeota archaeon]
MDKKLLGGITALLFLLPLVGAVNIGTGVGIDIQTEKFKPLIWMCDGRVVLDDPVEQGRFNETTELFERINNYAFTGEQIQWRVLVMDKNGIEKIKDVYVAVANESGEYIEANCVLDEVLGAGDSGDSIDSTCNA